MTELRSTIVLGEGILTWPPEERTLGRFGSVQLAHGADQYVSFRDAPVSSLACMTATVLKVRHATLPVDFVRKLAPTLPQWGEVIELGIGWVFQPDLAGRGVTAIGLAPPAEYWRGNEWLSPTALYRAHNHHVRLELHPYRAFTTEAAPAVKVA
jgi:hypothetical protein